MEAFCNLFNSFGHLYSSVTYAITNFYCIDIGKIQPSPDGKNLWPIEQLQDAAFDELLLFSLKRLELATNTQEHEWD